MKVKRCPACNHTYNSHTKGAHNNTGGCAYCKCRKVKIKMGGGEMLMDSPELSRG